MARSQADVIATALVAVLACGAAAAGAPVPVMTVLGVALFAAPGYLLGQVLVGSRVAGLERVAVMTGLALAVPVLGGLLLNVTGIPLHRPGWLGLLAVVTLAADTALFARRRAAGAGRADRTPTTVLRWPGWNLAVFATAALIAAAAVGLAVTGAARPPQPGFTQLWLSPQPPGTHALSLGVTNDQGRATRYRLVLQRGGRVIGTWDITLAPNRSWRREVPFTSQQTVAAGLYRLPDLTRPYRYVSVGPSSGAAAP